MDPRWWFVACLAARIGLVVAAKLVPRKWLPWMGAVALLPVLGFLALFAGLWRCGNGAFGQRILWNGMRSVHATAFLVFAILAFVRSPWAYVPLAADVALGAVAFGVHHCG